MISSRTTTRAKEIPPSEVENPPPFDKLLTIYPSQIFLQYGKVETLIASAGSSNSVKTITTPFPLTSLPIFYTQKPLPQT